MTISSLNAAKLGSATGRRSDHAQHSVGEQVRLKVLSRANDHRYLVSFRDGQHVVNSTVPLSVGSTVRAVVTAVGEQLELRYIDADDVTIAMLEQQAVGNDSISRLAARYAVGLRAGERESIERAMQDVAEPEVIASSGMFLSKLALPVDAANLQALHAVQSWQTSVQASPAADLAIGGPGALAVLAEQMLGALQPETADARSGDDGGQHDLAQRLLNEQDEGSIAYRFGVLPLLIDDQLLELDLVHFRARRDSAAAPDLRRLVMTFSTPTLGRIEILAQALDERLTIAIKADTAQSTELLAARAGEVRELVARLGWNVEAVSYEIAVDVGRGARHVLDHVLNADTLSRLV